MNAVAKPPQAAPDESTLTIRDRRFNRAAAPDPNADPVAAAWFTALSASFPRGEAMFIEAVRAHREGVPEPLATQIRDFIRQEVNHSREHIAFNRAAEASGFDLTDIDARVAAMIADTQSKPPVVQLAITMALEHFTAVFANLFLRDPESLAGAGMGSRELWQWHAVEEIEHKGVAFDTWLHATRDWAPRRRWIMRCVVMGHVTVRFICNRVADALELLAQRGITGWRAKWRLFTYLTVRPGIARRIFPMWIAWFRPGFHPWDNDDSALVAGYDGAQAATVSMIS